MDLVSSSKKPIQSAFYEKHGDKGLLLLKKNIPIRNSSKAGWMILNIPPQTSRDTRQWKMAVLVAGGLWFELNSLFCLDQHKKTSSLQVILTSAEMSNKQTNEGSSDVCAVLGTMSAPQ